MTGTGYLQPILVPLCSILVLLILSSDHPYEYVCDKKQKEAHKTHLFCFDVYLGVLVHKNISPTNVRGESCTTVPDFGRGAVQKLRLLARLKLRCISCPKVLLLTVHLIGGVRSGGGRIRSFHTHYTFQGWLSDTSPPPPLAGHLQAFSTRKFIPHDGGRP